MNEADTCRKFVLPKLLSAGWDADPHSFTEQRTFTDGRIVVAGGRTFRRPQKRADWANPEKRSDIIARLAERGIDFGELAAAAVQPGADPLDLLCHVAFNAPLRTRRERADRLRREKKDFFDRYGPEARAILNELLDKYTDHGAAEFVIPDVLKLPPLSGHGNPMEIASFFGGAEKLGEAVRQLQNLLYAA
ncbi:MAG: hypothetical protein A2Z34_02250 [Planctomycetes bacterium RBG_16_59_8]|nr:MAG: hypothetical protein A2Z34_02250 [Planctomycetes bacterium RBG_16_59_8]